MPFDLLKKLVYFSIIIIFIVYIIIRLACNKPKYMSVNPLDIRLKFYIHFNVILAVKPPFNLHMNLNAEN